MTEYKNARRSKKLIKEAFLSLMKEKPVERISICDIVRKAGLNRGTFYAHYQTPFDILREMEEEVNNRIFELMGDIVFLDFIKNPAVTFRAITEFLSKNKEPYQTFLRYYYPADFLKKLKDELYQKLLENTSIPGFIRTSHSFKIALDFVMEGAIATYRNWIIGDLVTDEKELNSILTKMVKKIASIFVFVI